MHVCACICILCLHTCFCAPVPCRTALCVGQNVAKNRMTGCVRQATCSCTHVHKSPCTSDSGIIKSAMFVHRNCTAEMCSNTASVLCRQAVHAAESGAAALKSSMKSAWKSRGAANVAEAAFSELCSGGWPVTCAAELVLTAVTSYHARRSEAALEQSIRVAASLYHHSLPGHQSTVLMTLGVMALHQYQPATVSLTPGEYLQHQEQQLAQDPAMRQRSQWQSIVMGCAAVSCARENPQTEVVMRRRQTEHEAWCKR